MPLVKELSAAEMNDTTGPYEEEKQHLKLKQFPRLSFEKTYKLYLATSANVGTYEEQMSVL